jgi:hypothetical protein
VLSVLRWRIYPAIYGFFRLDFWDEECERGYRKEMWYSSKVCAPGILTTFFLRVLLLCLGVWLCILSRPSLSILEFSSYSTGS